MKLSISDIIADAIKENPANKFELCVLQERVKAQNVLNWLRHSHVI